MSAKVSLILATLLCVGKAFRYIGVDRLSARLDIHECFAQRKRSTGIVVMAAEREPTRLDSVEVKM